MGVGAKCVCLCVHVCGRRGGELTKRNLGLFVYVWGDGSLVILLLFQQYFIHIRMTEAH